MDLRVPAFDPSSIHGQVSYEYLLFAFWRSAHSLRDAARRNFTHAGLLRICTQTFMPAPLHVGLVSKILTTPLRQLNSPLTKKGTIKKVRRTKRTTQRSRRLHSLRESIALETMPASRSTLRPPATKKNIAAHRPRVGSACTRQGCRHTTLCGHRRWTTLIGIVV